MEKNYDFRKRLLEIHKPDLRDTTVVCGKDEIEVNSETNIMIPADHDKVISYAAKDLQDYLFTSMGISVRIIEMDNIQQSLSSSKRNVVFMTQENIGEKIFDEKTPRAFCINCQENIVITGYDTQGALMGGFYIEDIMNVRHGPYIKKGTIIKKPLFSPRMVHSGYGLDYYPDEYLASIAHSGMDSILVYVAAQDQTPNGYLDFNGLCSRAETYGLSVYAYSYIKSEMHPDDPGAGIYYDRVYGTIFKSCPAFKGVVLVGESVEFPSKDERTTGKPYTTKTEEGLPPEKPSPGWWPCRDYPRWLEIIKTSVRRYRSDADIIFWTYNWGYVEEKYRLELIEQLPNDISLMVTFEMFEKIRTGAVTSTCVDYTLMFEGPGEYFISEAKTAKKKGIKLYSMTNTSGLTWDIGVVPYIPAPQQWIRRFEAVLKMKEEYGLCGLMESHHYGFWPSFISEMAKWIFTYDSSDSEEILKMQAENLFGTKYSETALIAWELWSEGIRKYISTNEDQYGPFRVGPSYPLALSNEVKIPDSRPVTFPNRFCKTMYKSADVGRCSLLSFRLPEEISSLTVMRDCFRAGAELISSILPSLHGRMKNDVERMVNLGQFISNCAQTTINVKKWYQNKLKLLSAARDDEIRSIVNIMIKIAEDEIANVQATIPLVQQDSRLGWEPKMEYMCDEYHLDWKIRQVKLMLRSELDMYIEALKYNI